MDKVDSVMNFVGEYSLENNRMTPETLEDLKALLVSVIELEDNQDMFENFLGAMLDSSRGLLDKYSIKSLQDIAFPEERNFKNDLEVLERVMNAVNNEKPITSGGHDVAELLKTITELESYRAETVLL